MKFNPKVSIVIPVYNGSNFLREAIESALAQTYSNIEVLVVNDGSNDEGKTEAIALSYGDRIRYFKKENGWVSSALNLGIREMTGDYFSWLSHDDIYYPDKVESQINYLSGLKNKSSIIYTDFSYIDSDSNFISNYEVKHVTPEYFRPNFIWGGLINGCTLLIPKECFLTCGVFNEKLRTTQDYDMWFRFSEMYPFVHLPQILVKSRLHPNQDTNRLKPLMKKEENHLFSYFISNIRKHEIKASYEKPIPLFYMDYSRVMMNSQLYYAAYQSFLLGLFNIWRLKNGYVIEYLSKTILILKANLKRFLNLTKRKDLSKK